MRVVELNHEIYPGALAYPGGPDMDIRRIRTNEADGWELTYLQISSHYGTHVDAPSHFRTGSGETLSAFRAERLIGRGIVLDVPREPGEGVGAAELQAALEAAERRGEALPDQPIILVHTGFMDRHGTDYEMYARHHPYVTADGARWLVDRGARICGIDASGFERHGSAIPGETVAHNTLLGAGVMLIEEMVNLRAVDWPAPLIVVAPLPIRDGDGAPARVFALEL
jgi:kynurenine formamidase